MSDRSDTPSPALSPDDSFIVELARTGIELVVMPGESILDVIRDAGLDANSSCEQGTCGACMVKVLAGIPDHFDAILTPEERQAGESMMICCSGSRTSRLVLDL
jgi:ferredoxin